VCRTEYRPGYTSCADCGSALVDELPPPPPASKLDGRIVEAGRWPSRFEAEVMAGRLRSEGLRATVPGDDADGWYPHLGLVHGYRVLVLEDDLEAAQELLAPAEPTRRRPVRRRRRSR
jgi:hypothetical protein